MSTYWNIPRYDQLSAEELRKKAEASSLAASNKGRKMEPVIINGRKIAERVKKTGRHAEMIITGLPLHFWECAGRQTG